MFFIYLLFFTVDAVQRCVNVLSASSSCVWMNGTHSEAGKLSLRHPDVKMKLK